MTQLVAIGLAALLTTVSAHAQHDAHTQMNKRGAHAMGFDQETTTHHFLLKPTGGIIQVVVKDPKDAKTADQIRMHLQHIRESFSRGDFALPMFVHEKMPPGADILKARHEHLTFRYETLTDGGQVVINTADTQALNALHQFLRFQILEHRTGDPLEVR